MEEDLSEYSDKDLEDVVISEREYLECYQHKIVMLEECKRDVLEYILYIRREIQRRENLK